MVSTRKKFISPLMTTCPPPTDPHTVGIRPRQVANLVTPLRIIRLLLRRVLSTPMILQKVMLKKNFPLKVVNLPLPPSTSSPRDFQSRLPLSKSMLLRR